MGVTGLAVYAARGGRRDGARLKFEQTQLTGARLEIAIRWVQFEDAPHGSRVLIRLVAAPNMGLRSVLAGNVAVDGVDWEEVAVG